LIFALTDETYSLVCTDHADVPPEHKTDYCLLVSMLDHFYWVAGSVLGGVVGSVITFNTAGIDFALTALFLTVFVEQWLSAKKHLPALIGVGGSALCLLIFGAENFLIPAMLVIALALSFYKGEARHD
jgi:4-azaleucine resistance transporter AzlC